MAVLMFEPDGTSAIFASAGHPPILVRRADTGMVEKMTMDADPLVGPFDHPQTWMLRQADVTVPSAGRALTTPAATRTGPKNKHQR